MTFANVNWEREQELRDEYKREWIDEQIYNAHMAEESLKTDMRHFIDQALENGEDPDYEAFCDEYHISPDLPAREELKLAGWFGTIIHQRKELEGIA